MTHDTFGVLPGRGNERNLPVGARRRDLQWRQARRRAPMSARMVSSRCGVYAMFMGRAGCHKPDKGTQSVRAVQAGPLTAAHAIVKSTMLQALPRGLPKREQCR